MQSVAPYEKINIVIADDHSIFREGLITVINKQWPFHITGQAENGQVLLSIIENQQPDIVIIDIRMPVMDGIKTTSIITQKFPDIKVIALTMFDDDKLIMEILNAGAKGYILKNADQTEIIKALKTVNQGGSYFFKDSIYKLIKSMSQASITNVKPCFTDKEITIMKLICKQYSNKEIASLLKSSVRSVESARERIQYKTGTKNMVGVAVYAMKNNIVNLTGD